MRKRLPITKSAEFDISSSKLWEVISEPGNLNNSHPFCKSNEVINWENEGRTDRLIYLNGLDYIRTFKTWNEGSGYTLEIGKEGESQSYVIWEIESLGVNSSRLKITVYRIFWTGCRTIWLSYFGLGAELFRFMDNFHSTSRNENSVMVQEIWVKPRLESYLNSVISGFHYYIDEDKKVPRNHFGKHSWFS